MLCGLIIEHREMHIPPTPANLDESLRTLYQLHFNRRNASELEFFTDDTFPEVETLRVAMSELNEAGVHEFLQTAQPDLFISYGIHMLSNETLGLLSGEAWNIHGGLSPWYRGCITHFWPSYLLEPQMTGMTVHDLTAELDAGPVVHQNTAPMIRGDGLHDVACRAVLGLADELPQLIELQSKLGKLERQIHTTTGKLWRAADWHPSHLKLIYDVFDDRIVDRYLDGQLSDKPINIFRQFT